MTAKASQRPSIGPTTDFPAAHVSDVERAAAEAAIAHAAARLEATPDDLALVTAVLFAPIQSLSTRPDGDTNQKRQTRPTNYIARSFA